MPFESLGGVSYSPSIVTMVVSVAVCEIFSVKEWCDLEKRSGFVQSHWQWHHLIERQSRFLTAHQHKIGHSVPFEVKIESNGIIR